MAIGGVLAAALLWTAVELAQPAQAYAQSPEGVDGPWLNIFQLVWFTNPDYANSGTDQDYTSNYGQKYEYGRIGVPSATTMQLTGLTPTRLTRCS